MPPLGSDGIFNKGVVCDTFKPSGRDPDSKVKLTMLVMGVSNTSRQDSNNLVGNGPRSQYFNLICSDDNLSQCLGYWASAKRK